MNPLKRNNRGMSLVTVLVAVFIMGVISAGVTSMIVDMFRSSAAIKNDSYIQDMVNETRTALSDPGICTATLAEFSTKSFVNGEKNSINVANIVMPDGKKLVSLNTPVKGLLNSRITGMTLSEIQPFNTSKGYFIADLTIAIDKEGTLPANKTGSSLGSRNINRKLPLFIEAVGTNPNFSIVRCFATTGNGVSDLNAYLEQSCSSVGGSFNTGTKICTVNTGGCANLSPQACFNQQSTQITNLNNTVTTLSRTVATLQEQIKSSTTPAPVVTPTPTPTPTTVPIPVAVAPPVTPTQNGGGACALYTSGPCAGSCGGYSGCPSTWKFSGAGQDGGCAPGYASTITSSSASGMTGFYCTSTSTSTVAAGTANGGGSCTPLPSGTCKGTCGGYSGCPSTWTFTGAGVSGGCLSGYTIKTNGTTPSGVQSYLCIKN